MHMALSRINCASKGDMSKKSSLQTQSGAVRAGSGLAQKEFAEEQYAAIDF